MPRFDIDPAALPHSPAPRVPRAAPWVLRGFTIRAPTIAAAEASRAEPQRADDSQRPLRPRDLHVIAHRRRRHAVQYAAEFLCEPRVGLADDPHAAPRLQR